MSSASSVMPTADCFIYHVPGACLPLHDFSSCHASLLIDERRNFDFVSPHRSSTSLLYHFHQAG
ncbi:hypothetical protein [Paraburkholderia sp. RL17-337-BIB-A]|uniref:hypothetical protein n=1 Tax=Paraburkholderia sp. RL17-337-BIB-A TaxID=3031636 RepID=UPI0038B9332E